MYVGGYGGLSESRLCVFSGMFVCSSFLFSVCMFIVSKSLLISSAIVIVRAWGTILLNPFATLLFSVCSACHGRMLCFVPCCMDNVCCYVGKKSLLQCLQLLRGGIWACMRYPCLCLCWVLGYGLY